MPDDLETLQVELPSRTCFYLAAYGVMHNISVEQAAAALLQSEINTMVAGGVLKRIKDEVDV